MLDVNSIGNPDLAQCRESGRNLSPPKPLLAAGFFFGGFRPDMANTGNCKDILAEYFSFFPVNP
jgi:hypothetical protein